MTDSLLNTSSTPATIVAPARGAETTPQVALKEVALTTSVSLKPDEYREVLKASLPESSRPYTDKYFLRANEILQKEGLNPFIKGQIFIRKGPGEVFGIEEALAILDKYSNLKNNGGSVYAKKDGDKYSPLEPVMFINARVQDIMGLETMYLGVIAAQTTRFNESVKSVNLDQVRNTVKAVVAAAQGRPVSYFGARHWDFREDAAIAQAAFEGGASSASTDIGARTAGMEGVGTIPHALENVFALYYGADRAVVEATKAFDRHIDPKVPRVALIDYNNREIDDSVNTAKALNGRLSAVRVDTCGENIAQGSVPSLTSPEAAQWRAKGLPLPDAKDPDARYWTGHGVTITGVYNLRKALDQAGFSEVKIVLTSGFGNPKKVDAFVRAEEMLGVRLFDALGVGGVYSPCRSSKMDIVFGGKTPESMQPVSKKGRGYTPNPNLERRL